MLDYLLRAFLLRTVDVRGRLGHLAEESVAELLILVVFIVLLIILTASLGCGRPELVLGLVVERERLLLLLLVTQFGVLLVD